MKIALAAVCLGLLACKHEPPAATAAPLAPVAAPSAPAAVGGDTRPSSSCTGGAMECKAISECVPGKGHITTLGQCANPSLACCVPESACPPEDFSCCAGTAQFRPSCDDGKLVCAANQKRCE